MTPVFLGAGKECFMRLNARVYNPGINSVEIDSLTVRSHTPDWSSEIDRFEYRPNPGALLAPADDERRPLQPDPAALERDAGELELPLVGQLHLHLLAAHRAGAPARRSRGTARRGSRTARHRRPDPRLR